MRYRRGLPLVLKSVNVEIKPGEKVGVCGRTGAGKSSLGRALLRLVDGDDEDNSCGSVEIDGVDIATVGRERLREAVTVIPQVCTQACQENVVTPHLFSLQHPTFFSGSLRFNLRPQRLEIGRGALDSAGEDPDEVHPGQEVSFGIGPAGKKSDTIEGKLM